LDYLFIAADQSYFLIDICLTTINERTWFNLDISNQLTKSAFFF